MSKFATKAAANMFCQARYEAAKSNERLSSREGAAEEIGIDRTRLARIELGSTIPYQEGSVCTFPTVPPLVSPFRYSSLLAFPCSNAFKAVDAVPLPALTSIR